MSELLKKAELRIESGPKIPIFVTMHTDLFLVKPKYFTISTNRKTTKITIALAGEFVRQNIVAGSTVTEVMGPLLFAQLTTGPKFTSRLLCKNFCDRISENF